MDVLEDWEFARLYFEVVHEIGLIFADGKETFKRDEFRLVVVAPDLADVAIFMAVDAGVSVGAMPTDHEVFAVPCQVGGVSVSMSMRVGGVVVLTVATEALVSLILIRLLSPMLPFHRRPVLARTLPIARGEFVFVSIPLE